MSTKYLIGKILIFLILALSGCKTEKPEPKICFWRFSHVFETCSRDRSVLKHTRTTEPLSKEERDTLIKLLKEDGWDFFQAKDGSIWVSELDVPDLLEMYNLDCRIFERMKRQRVSWKFDDE